MPKTKSRKATTGRPDGRKPLLVYMSPEVIRELKKAALDADRNAYEIVEEPPQRGGARWLLRSMMS